MEYCHNKNIHSLLLIQRIDKKTALNLKTQKANKVQALKKNNKNQILTDFSSEKDLNPKLNYPTKKA